jgi:hypothetical protein
MHSQKRRGIRHTVDLSFSHRLSQGRRLVDTANQSLQPKRKPAPFRLRQEAPQLALAAVRLDREPARMQARCGAAEFNLRPMPREHELNGMLTVPELDADVRFGDRYRLAVMAPLHAGPERPSQKNHFQPGERQYWPEAAGGHDCGNGERNEADAAEKQQSGANAERAMRADFDALRLGVHSGATVIDA